MWEVLKQFGFGPKFISMVQTLYNTPLASVITGSHQSPPFTLQRGTRQGCPLSPLLFALSVEPIAQAVREHDYISPISIHGTRHFISLYADDILLFLSNIESSVPHVLHLFEEFKEIAGYKINWSKSVLLPINSEAKTIPLPPGIPSNSTMRYLGVDIYTNIAKTVNDNYTKVLQKVKGDIQRWSVLPVSLQGRNSIIKMNILPRFNFLFFMLPAPPPCEIP